MSDDTMPSKSTPLLDENIHEDDSADTATPDIGKLLASLPADSVTTLATMLQSLAPSTPNNFANTLAETNRADRIPVVNTLAAPGSPARAVIASQQLAERDPITWTYMCSRTVRKDNHARKGRPPLRFSTPTATGLASFGRCLGDDIRSILSHEIGMPDVLNLYVTIASKPCSLGDICPTINQIDEHLYSWILSSMTSSEGVPFPGMDTYVEACTNSMSSGFVAWGTLVDLITPATVDTQEDIVHCFLEHVMDGMSGTSMAIADFCHPVLHAPYEHGPTGPGISNVVGTCGSFSPDVLPQQPDLQLCRGPSGPCLSSNHRVNGPSHRTPPVGSRGTTPQHGAWRARNLYISSCFQPSPRTLHMLW